MVTIQDVARETGLSVATVSRVINRSGNVRPETQKRVLEAVKKLGYQPNLLGRNLRRRETNMVLVLINTIVNSFYAKVIKGIENVAEANGYHIMICTTYSDPARERSYLEMLTNRLVDGAVFLSASLNAEELTRLHDRFAVVQCCEYVEGAKVPCVRIDNEHAGYDATNHLIRMGRHEIIHLTADEPHLIIRQRHMGYRRALEEHGIVYRKDRVLYGNFGFRNAKAQTKAYLENGARFDGAFASSDRMAAGLIRSCEEAGMHVPEDVAVVGFDNVDISYMMSPELTTISQSQYGMGAEAMRLLLARLSGQPKIRTVEIPYELIVRQSAPLR